MGALAEKYWPPTKSYRLSVAWSFIFGSVLQIALPLLLFALGAKQVALVAILPGLLPLTWVTRGWFAGIAPLGYALMFGINTIVYAIFLLAAFRICVCLRNPYEN
jgi:hypothetical protein